VEYIRRPNAAQRMLKVVREFARAGASLAAFVLAAAWLLTAMPQALREVAGLPAMDLPSAARLTGLVHVSLAGGYDVATALPFMIGFLALFVALGLMSGDGWTRLWAPLIGAASAWAWAASPGGTMGGYLLIACAVVIVGGVLASGWRLSASLD
jgi:hypothetical protein